MGRAQKILAVDDDPDILELLRYNLSKEGFKVKTIEDSSKAIDASLHFNPDLIILDIMMPHISGIEICKQLREMPRFQNTYIFFLTAKSEHYYQEAALDTGGDDFIEKIIGLRALTNKVTTVLKRNFVIHKNIQMLSVGDLTIDRRKSVVYIKNVPQELSKPELELLFFFAQNPKKIITLQNLLNNIWGSDIYSMGTSLERYLENLSAKLDGRWLLHLGEGKYKLTLR